MPSGKKTGFRAWLASDAAGGVVLMASAALALIIANSPWQARYFQTLEAHAGPLSVLHWINDALMALFFLHVGLEIKRELVAGHLSAWSKRALPGFAAFGGMLAPALVYLAVTHRHPGAAHGWAIPAATDIAFALGVLALVGKGLPSSLKIFLTALAVVDDLGAIVIIALFYTTTFSLPMFGMACLCLAALIGLNYFGVRRLWPYLLIGLPLWFFTFRSGVHATIAGVALAACIPLTSQKDGQAPLYRLEHALSPWVIFAIMPIFGFANAGVSFSGVTLEALLHPVTMGVALGLFLGKQIGVFSLSWLSIMTGLAQRPKGASWLQVYGVALICGVGFTMSLFVGMLAFTARHDLMEETKIGVLMGSVASALAGAFVLRLAKR